MQIEDSRRQLTGAVQHFLRAVAASPGTHQQGRDNARQHGGYDQAVAHVGGNCKVYYNADGSLTWVITSHALSDTGTVTIEENGFWVIHDDTQGNGSLVPVADSSQQGSSLSPTILLAVVGEVETILHAYERNWLTAPQASPRPAQPQQVFQQISRQTSKPIATLVASVCALTLGWCCFPLGWIALIIAGVMVYKEHNKLQGRPMPTMLKASAIITAISVVSVLLATLFWVSQMITAFNSTPY